MLILLIALSLSMDAFAVSVSNGLCFSNMGKRNKLFSCATFGIAQAVMPLIGYLCGRTFAEFVGIFTHYVAFGLLMIIGGNMIVEGIRELREGTPICPKAYTTKLMIVQAVATSIDALAAGISFAMMETNIGVAAAAIGSITFILCLFGVSFSQKFGRHLKDKSVIIGGTILCLIGLKILLEGLYK